MARSIAVKDQTREDGMTKLTKEKDVEYKTKEMAFLDKAVWARQFAMLVRRCVLFKPKPPIILALGDAPLADDAPIITMSPRFKRPMRGQALGFDVTAARSVSISLQEVPRDACQDCWEEGRLQQVLRADASPSASTRTPPTVSRLM